MNLHRVSLQSQTRLPNRPQVLRKVVLGVVVGIVVFVLALARAQDARVLAPVADGRLPAQIDHRGKDRILLVAIEIQDGEASRFIIESWTVPF